MLTRPFVFTRKLYAVRAVKTTGLAALALMLGACANQVGAVEEYQAFEPSGIDEAYVEVVRVLDLELGDIVLDDDLATAQSQLQEMDPATRAGRLVVNRNGILLIANSENLASGDILTLTPDLSSQFDITSYDFLDGNSDLVRFRLPNIPEIVHFDNTNGKLNPSLLVDISQMLNADGYPSCTRTHSNMSDPCLLRPDAAASWQAMLEAGFPGFLDETSQTYRNYPEQQWAYRCSHNPRCLTIAPRNAAVPGTSTHGYAAAVDATGYGRNWLARHGRAFGWSTRVGGSPWHFDFNGNARWPATPELYGQEPPAPNAEIIDLGNGEGVVLINGYDVPQLALDHWFSQVANEYHQPTGSVVISQVIHVGISDRGLVRLTGLVQENIDWAFPARLSTAEEKPSINSLFATLNEISGLTRAPIILHTFVDPSDELQQAVAEWNEANSHRNSEVE